MTPWEALSFSGISSAVVGRAQQSEDLLVLRHELVMARVAGLRFAREALNEAEQREPGTAPGMRALDARVYNVHLVHRGLDRRKELRRAAYSLRYDVSVEAQQAGLAREDQARLAGDTQRSLSNPSRTRTARTPSTFSCRSASSNRCGPVHPTRLRWT